MAKWNLTMPWRSQAPALCSSHSFVAPGSTARTSAMKQYTLMYCHEASPDTIRTQVQSKPDASQPGTVSKCACDGADESQMPLIGKRIMITAPRQYAHKLAAYLIMAGARPVWVPSISITHIRHEDKSKVSLKYLCKH